MPLAGASKLHYSEFMISFWQLAAVVIILLIVFGPSRIEGLGSSLGKAIRGFKKGINDEEEKVNQAKKINPSEEEDSPSKT